jgi:transposase
MPLAVRVAAGNENEREHMLPLLDSLIARGIHPGEVWADRGYDSERLTELLSRRGIRAQISKRRRAGDPIPAGTPTRQVVRGSRHQTKPSDPQGRHRWPVERTNAWLKAKRRIATRRDRNPDTYLAFIQLGMLLILARPL